MSYALDIFAIMVLSSGMAAAEPTTDGYRNLRRHPDAVAAITETGTVDLVRGVTDAWSGAGIRVTTAAKADGLHVSLAAPEVAVKKLRLHWQGAPETGGWKYLGDAWERGYGDLEWRTLDGKRRMPWYLLASDGRLTHAYGVMTQPAALCCWNLDQRGLTLLADVRCGGAGVRLGRRTLEVCTVTSRRGRDGETPFAAARAFCRQLCPTPRLPQQPVYGFNNWYCDYGNASADSVRQDAAFIARLAPRGCNRPFMVIDDGWQANHGDAKGEWDRGNAKFPDMAALAADMVKAGTRPGIWVRLLVAQPDQPEGWRLARDHALLDPSVPEVRAYVTATARRLRGWGYELIKHDYSTFDLTGRWGFQMDDEMTAGGWAFADRSRTTAEIILDHYRSIRAGAGDAVLIGCNTIGHLSAGIFEVTRTGDDTSGKEWDRVRKMGVNTLAFRMPQHGAFFAVDADCVGQTATNSIPWDKNQQWLDLLARSGTPLFVSFKRGSVTPEQERALKVALATASKPAPTGEPLDWFDTLLPRRWRLAGSESEFDWFDVDPPTISGSGNFTNGEVSGAVNAKFSTLAAAGAHAMRMSVYPYWYYGKGGPTPGKLDAQILAAHRQGVRTIMILFEYSGQYARHPDLPNQLGDASKWQAIGRAFAERFAPNSQFLTSHGIRDWGVTIYQAMNEPDIDRTIPLAGPSSYVSALEGLADGVHAVNPRLAVVPGGLATENSSSSHTLNGYGKAIASLLNNGKLDGIDLHTYNDIKWAPIVREDGQVTFGFSPQSAFDNVKKACGITRDINFYCTEYNFKSAEQGIDESLAAKRLLTCIWANLGVVKFDGHTPATKLALIWNLFNSAEKDKTYGLTAPGDPRTLTARGKTFQLVMALSSGMTFTHLDPRGRGEFTLAGNGKTLWVWQNYEAFSSIHGTRYTITGIPPSAKTLQVYGWDGIRKRIDLRGQTSLAIEDLNERETYMFMVTP